MTRPSLTRFIETLILGCFLLALAVLSAPPAAAASDDFKGWLLSLDLALTQPEGLDSHIATVQNGTALPPATERIVMNLKSDATWAASAGYNFGLDLGQVKVSYWSFDNDDSENFSKAGFVSPALFGYGYYGYMLLCNTASGPCDPSQPVAFTGKTGLKASTWDLDYSRTMEVSERFGLKWLAGLRTASYEEEQAFTGFDGTYNYRQARSWSADALGIRVGATGIFGLTRHFGLQAGAAWSEMMASTDGKSSQTYVDGGVNCGFPPCDEIATGKDDHLHGSIVDLNLKGVWSAGPVDISLGFTSSRWSGFVQNPVPQNGFLLNSESPSQDSIGFSSFEVGFLWRIGASHQITSP